MGGSEMYLAIKKYKRDNKEYEYLVLEESVPNGDGTYKKRVIEKFGNYAVLKEKHPERLKQIFEDHDRKKEISSAAKAELLTTITGKTIAGKTQNARSLSSYELRAGDRQTVMGRV